MMNGINLIYINYFLCQIFIMNKIKNIFHKSFVI